MKEYKYVKTWRENGKRRVVRADSEGEMWEKYYLAKYGVEGINHEITTQEALELLKGSPKKSKVGITLNDYAWNVVETYKKGAVSDVYYYTYIKGMDKHILRVIGSLDIGEVTADDVQRVLSALRGTSQNLINQVHQTLRFIFGIALKDGVIPSDPTLNLIKPKAKEKEKRRALTDEERSALLQVFKVFSSEMRVFKIMYYTGARPSEVWRMQRRDIVSVNGKNIIKIKGTKTQKASRSVPFPDEIFDDVKDLPESSLLVTSWSGHPMNKTLYKRRSHRLKRELDIAMGATVKQNKIIESKLNKFTPYNLRHDYCTRLRDGGVDIRIAKELMGHSTISMTAEIYTHTTDKDVAKQWDSIMQGVTQGVSSEDA